MKTNSLALFGFAAFAAVALSGCNLTGALEAPPALPTGNAPKDDYKPASDAGVPVSPSADAGRLTKLVATRNASGAYGTSRTDPFALTPEEKAFETQQSTERFFGSTGGFSVQITPKPVVDEEVIAPEAQPYRRLSGIVVGDSVLAILEEGGQSTIITPGMQIPNSQWRVVSIDQDKAVLRRSGNIKPTQIIVRLEVPPAGQGPAAGGGGFPGGPGGGGYPGGPGGSGYPGGYPGGPGGRGPGGMGGEDR